MTAQEVAAFVQANLPGTENGWGQYAAQGFTDASGEIVAGVIYHNYYREAGVVEITAASTVRNWLTKERLSLIFAFPFDGLGCQMCIARIAEDNHRARRIWRHLGATEFVIPRLQGRDKAEVISTLTDDAWREFARRL